MGANGLEDKKGSVVDRVEEAGDAEVDGFVSWVIAILRDAWEDRRDYECSTAIMINRL